MKIYQYLTETDIRALPANTVAILPLGAIENHGNHLPLGTDGILADAITDRAARHLTSTNTPAVRLPCLWLGASVEHTARPGTVSTPATRLIETTLDILAGLAKNAITRVVLLSAHGGNTPPARIIAVEARARHAMLCATPHWMDFGLPEGIAQPTPARGDAHAGWLETSMMLATDSDLVQRTTPTPASTKTAPAAMLYPEGAINWGWMSDDLGTQGVIGDPTGSTAEMGEKILDHAGHALANLVSQLAEADWPPRQVQSEV